MPDFEHLGLVWYEEPGTAGGYNWNVWGLIEDDSTVGSILYGKSSLLNRAAGPILRQNCTTPLLRKLLAHADAEVAQLSLSVDWGKDTDDFVVIEIFDEPQERLH